MEKKMIEVLNTTLMMYESVREMGNTEAANRYFGDFQAQAMMVKAVTGKNVIVKGFKAELI